LEPFCAIGGGGGGLFCRQRLWMLATLSLCLVAAPGDSGQPVSVRKDCQAWHKAPEMVHSDLPYKAFMSELLTKLQRVSARPSPAAAAFSSDMTPFLQTQPCLRTQLHRRAVLLCRPT
jgi:hypothetical protein